MSETNPFKGLSPFTTSDENHFWGRDNETSDLFSHISCTNLMVVYGKSGIGKTSILQAGVIPVLKQNSFFPVYARVEDDPITSIQHYVIKAFADRNQIGLKVAPDLPEFFEQMNDFMRQKNGNSEEMAIVLLLDQFEDFFGSFQQNGVQKKREEFIEQLARITYRRDLPIIFVLSLREDFLPELAIFRRKIPQILSNYYRLTPLLREKAREAITKPLEGSGVEFQEELIEKILDDLEKSGDGGIEPYALQMVCSYIWDSRGEDQYVITENFYTKKLGGLQNILGDFISKKLEEFPVENQSVIKKIFSELFTSRGRGRLVHVTSIFEKVKDEIKSEDELKKSILEPLDKKYRFITIRSIKNVLYCEPIHDTLSQKASQWKQELERNALEEKLREEHTKKRKKLLIISGIFILAILLVIAFIEIISSMKARDTELQLERKKNENINRIAFADSLNNIGNKKMLIKDYDKASEMFTKSFDIYNELNDNKKKISTLIALGNIYRFEFKYEDAKQKLNQALEIGKRLGDKQAVGQVLERLASLSDLEGKKGEASKLYEQAHENFEKAGEEQSSGRVLEKLAFQAEESRDFIEAEKQYIKARESYTVAGDQMGIERIGKSLERINEMFAPWGFLRDLNTGKIFQLKGTQVNIGRSITESNVTNEISFENRLISRHHLLIRKDLSIEDLRSRNGTSVNAQLLYYGLGTKLYDQDIITLANIRALQFTISSPSASFNIPPNVWAIFIDGRSKSYHYLTEQKYSVFIINGGLELKPGISETAQLKIRWQNGKAEMFELADDWSLIFTYKETDYDYKTYISKTNEWFEALDVPVTYVKLSNDKKQILLNGPSFQIILFNN